MEKIKSLLKKILLKTQTSIFESNEEKQPIFEIKKNTRENLQKFKSYLGATAIGILYYFSGPGVKLNKNTPSQVETSFINLTTKAVLPALAEDSEEAEIAYKIRSLTFTIRLKKGEILFLKNKLYQGQIDFEQYQNKHKSKPESDLFIVYEITLTDLKDSINQQKIQLRDLKRQLKDLKLQEAVLKLKQAESDSKSSEND